VRHFSLTAHGALSAAVVRRLSMLGLRDGLRDGRVLAGAGMVALALIFVWFATDFARNPA